MRRFKLPKIRKSTNKLVRFPNEMIEDIEKALVGADCTFSAFVIEAVRIAIEEIKEEANEFSER